jgi:hypothetical protein
LRLRTLEAFHHQALCVSLPQLAHPIGRPAVDGWIDVADIIAAQEKNMTAMNDAIAALTTQVSSNTSVPDQR